MTQDYWKEKIEQWQISGKSMAEFCRHEDLSYWTFRDWKKRLNKKTEIKMVKLDTEKLKTNSTSFSSLQIALKGITITIPHHYDEKQLLKIISSLRKLP